MPTETAPSWELYGTFLQVMREGSLSGASRTLGVAQPTVRRRIAALEEALGATLFSRAPNGLVPTDAAMRALPFAETMEATSRSIVRALSSDPSQPRGTVRISASEIVGVEVLPPILANLRRRWPEITVELTLSNRIADLMRRDADIAVRMTAPSASTLVARRIGTIPFGFFATPDYLRRHGTPECLDDLRRHELVGYDQNPQLLEGLAALGLVLSADDFAFRTDHDLAFLGAIRAGLGIGVVQVPLAHGLVRLLPGYDLPLDVWLVAHEDLRQVRRIRVVLDHLAEALRSYLDV